MIKLYTLLFILRYRYTIIEFLLVMICYFSNESSTKQTMKYLINNVSLNCKTHLNQDNPSRY